MLRPEAAASKVNLRIIRRVNPTMKGFRPALSVMLVSPYLHETGSDESQIIETEEVGTQEGQTSLFPG